MTRSRILIYVGLCAVVFVGSLIGLVATLSGPDETAARTVSVDLIVVPEVMTAAHKAYAGASGTFLAKTVIKNTGTQPITNFHLSYKIPGYAETAGQEDYPIILPGQTVHDYCYPTFDSDQMKAIESETPAEVDVTYTYDGCQAPKGTSAVFSFLGHNDWVRTYLPKTDRLTFADTLDNAAMIAAWVTKNDPNVERIAKKVTADLWTAKDEGAWRATAAIYDFVRASPLRYVTESDSYWAADSQHVQYPAETLANESGNCIDLSILFAALLESVGVESTLCFSTGHCQVAFTLPESGDMFVIEATAIANPSITFEDSLRMGRDRHAEQTAQQTWVQVNVRDEWANGMVPSW